jgi:hypothetical protein
MDLTKRGDRVLLMCFLTMLAVIFLGVLVGVLLEARQPSCVKPIRERQDRQVLCALERAQHALGPDLKLSTYRVTVNHKEAAMR